MKERKPEQTTVLDEEIWNCSGVVYARTHEAKIVYIGSTDGPLCERLRSHLRLIHEYDRGKAAQYREWAEGKHITIFAHHPCTVKLLGRQIPVHRAIEAALIKEFRRPRESDWFVARC